MKLTPKEQGRIIQSAIRNSVLTTTSQQLQDELVKKAAKICNKWMAAHKGEIEKQLKEAVDKAAKREVEGFVKDVISQMSITY
jgi:hypothetical protein